MPGAAICRQHTRLAQPPSNTVTYRAQKNDIRKTKFLGNTEFHRRKKNTVSYKYYNVLLMAHVSLEVVPVIYFDLSAPQEAEWKPHTIPVPSTC